MDLKRSEVDYTEKETTGMTHSKMTIFGMGTGVERDVALTERWFSDSYTHRYVGDVIYARIDPRF